VYQASGAEGPNTTSNHLNRDRMFGLANNLQSFIAKWVLCHWHKIIRGLWSFCSLHAKPTHHHLGRT